MRADANPIKANERAAARARSCEERAGRLSAEWASLCARYLPVTPEGSVWRYSRTAADDDPEQGWKIHVAATILSAGRVMKRVASGLQRDGILFKAPASLHELRKINCGAFYGFSQVGKFMTVYPRGAREAVRVARALDRLTRGLPCPKIPFDLPFRDGGCVSYRYGSYSSSEVEFPDGTRCPAIRNPAGALVPDRRAQGPAVPPWIKNPFPQPRQPERGPLGTTVRAYEALSQRGKGGVYRAVDVGVNPARDCILKEGRRHGETCWDGRDGFWRTRHETRVLSELAAAGVCVPQVYRTFRSGQNFYLVMEAIEGRTLQEILDASREGLMPPQALRYGAEIAALLSRMHSAGWVWRDCKPSNIIVTGSGLLRPLDFEGACRVAAGDAEPWVTSEFVPGERDGESDGRSGPAEDLYALGVTLGRLCGLYEAEEDTTWRERDASARAALRRDVPLRVRKLVNSLLSRDAEARPEARTVAEALRRSGGRDWQSLPAPPVVI